MPDNADQILALLRQEIHDTILPMLKDHEARLRIIEPRTSVLSERLSNITLILGSLSLVLSAIAAYIGRLP